MQRRNAGGIIGLIRLNEETDRALEADFLERLGVRFEDVPNIGWEAALVFARHVARDPRSYTFRAINPDLADFASPWKQSAILADIYDAIRHFHWQFICSRLEKHAVPPPTPKPYPRPGVDDGSMNIGKGGLPPDQFESWYYGGE